MEKKLSSVEETLAYASFLGRANFSYIFFQNVENRFVMVESPFKLS